MSQVPGVSPPSRPVVGQPVSIPSSSLTTGPAQTVYTPSHAFSVLNGRVTAGALEPVEAQLAVILASPPRPVDMMHSVAHAFSRGKEVIAEMLLDAFSGSIRGLGALSAQPTDTASTDEAHNIPVPVLTQILLLAAPHISMTGVESLVSRGARITNDLVFRFDTNSKFDVVKTILDRYGFQQGLVGCVYSRPGDPGSSEFRRAVSFVGTVFNHSHPSELLEALPAPTGDHPEWDGKSPAMTFIINRLEEYNSETAAPISNSKATSDQPIAERVVHDLIAIKAQNWRGLVGVLDELKKPHVIEA